MGCSRFGLGLVFPKSTKEPTGRAGCLGGMAWFDFDEITYSFFITGHSYNENDVIHSLIGFDNFEKSQCKLP